MLVSAWYAVRIRRAFLTLVHIRPAQRQPNRWCPMMKMIQSAMFRQSTSMT